MQIIIDWWKGLIELFANNQFLNEDGTMLAAGFCFLVMLFVARYAVDFLRNRI